MAEPLPPQDITGILRLLPHRYPFIMIDRLEEVSPGSSSDSRLGRKFRCIKNVTINEPYFTGHFPGNPVMPGVLIVEAMAQAAALACYNVGEPACDFYLLTVNGAKFRRKVVPGDRLLISGEITRDKGSMIVTQVACSVEGHVVAEAEVMAKIYPREEA